ncbi:hypothetical protein ACQF36_29190 [Streptomyces sp. Marseille-Q5077]|uniref:hypothetical protein n=1 Tax=Streptomyces sp. Marseille-Q5077 TaxID=3418995 RepID=UPI003CFBDE3F
MGPIPAPTGVPASLTDAARDLGELDARLSRTSVEVEVHSVTGLTVWAYFPRTADECCDLDSSVLPQCGHTLSLFGGSRCIADSGEDQALLGPGAGRPPPVSVTPLV